LGGQGELLMITAFGGARLPSGDLLPNESIHEGTARVVQRVTGARVEPRRVAFLLERVGDEWLIGVLCELAGDGEISESRPGVRFVALASGTHDFDPPALRELLVEDSASGFVRPTAHIAISTDERGEQTVTTTW
jgi:hypothetical protein